MRHNESKLQQSCVRYFRYTYPQYAHLLFAVPNGGYRNAKEASILKSEGVVAGVSDLILLVPKNGIGALCIEMKESKGVQREAQKMWQKETEKVGNKYVIVRSFDEFREAVIDYLCEDDCLDVQSARNQLDKLLYKGV